MRTEAEIKLMEERLTIAINDNKKNNQQQLAGDKLIFRKALRWVLGEEL